MTFYIKNTNEHSILYKIACCLQMQKYLKLLKFTQLLNLDITIYIKDQYENTKYSRTLLHTKPSLYLSQVNCTVIEHTT